MATPDALKEIVSPILGAAVFLAAVSTVAVAIVEFVKALTRARLFFHRWSVRKWTANLNRSAWGLVKDLVNWCIGEAFGNPIVEEAVLGELLLLAAGGHDYDKALYDQPIEKMMAQIQAAANVALEFPNEYPSLYGFLTQSDVRDKKLSTATEATIVPINGPASSKPDVDKNQAAAAAANLPTGEGDQASSQQRATVIEQTDSKPSRAGADPSKWMTGMDAMRMAHRARIGSVKFAENLGEVDPAITKEAEDAGKARSRINNLVARKLDAFQNETRYMWDRLNQMIASALCGGIIWDALLRLKPELIPGFPQTNSAIVFWAIFGGIAAPFAKDVVTGLSSFAKKP